MKHGSAGAFLKFLLQSERSGVVLIFILPVASGCESPASHLEKTLQALKLHRVVIQQCIKSCFHVGDQECHSLG